MSSYGIDELDQVTLDAHHGRLLDEAQGRSVGAAHWRAAKTRETHKALALAQIAPRDRLRVLDLDMTGHVELVVHMKVPVGCMAPHHHQLVVFTDALMFVRYPEEIMFRDLPGTSFAQIRQPRYVWHANVDFDSGTLCLGLTLPRNVPLAEILWLSYTALAMQTWMIDTRDGSGVLNANSARWWAVNQDKLPLSRTALLDDQPLAMNPALDVRPAPERGVGA